MQLILSVPLLAAALLAETELSPAATVQEPQAVPQVRVEPKWMTAVKHVRPVAENENPKPARQVVFLGPKSTCFGRFGDSLKQNVLDPNPWVQGVQLDRGFDFEPDPVVFHNDALKRGEMEFGAPTRITITVDADATDVQVIGTLRDSYDVKGWKVQRWIPLGQEL